MKIQFIVERCDPAVKVSRSNKDATLTRDDGNTICLPPVETGGGRGGGIELSAFELEGACDVGFMGLVGAHSIDTVCRSPVQRTIVEKRSNAEEY